MPFPFEVEFGDLQADIGVFVDSVFASLESDFLVMPKGDGFVEYPVFEAGYESLKRATANFAVLPVENVLSTVMETPISLVVLRSMLGFTPPEWAYVATQRTGVDVTQGSVRAIDRAARLSPLAPVRNTRAVARRVEALVRAACELLQEGAPSDPSGTQVHRLQKVDTSQGIDSVRHMAAMGAPYPVLLYERFLGRPFAGHRDSVSELVGGRLEDAVETALVRAGISYRKTRRAERIPGFDQTPDFIVPSEFNPQVVIEAKAAEDDGTARDKVTRVQHLAELATAAPSDGRARFEVVACIAGRGFAVRRSNVEKLLLATRGKLFTLRQMDRLVQHTGLRAYRSQP